MTLIIVYSKITLIPTITTEYKDTNQFWLPVNNPGVSHIVWKKI